MNRIYRSVMIVNVWLGDAAHNSNAVFVLIKKFCEVRNNHIPLHGEPKWHWPNFKADIARYGHFSDEVDNQLQA